jgi:alkanesulfonate monooxygenase SsuD/methylene tetrahydromethanopterin reductase-like flavin-dependent oxidoreductase (luciferase family)
VLWTDERVTFRGRFVHLEDAAFFPKPVQKPHPPVWIGGASDRALERVVRVGAGWIAAPRPDLAALAADVARLRRVAETRGRDPATIGVASGGAARTVDDLVARLPDLTRAGVTLASVPVVFWARSVAHALELLEEFAGKVGLPAVGERPRIP